ncbi:MAG: OmpA family protein [Chitinophagales bacterium]
MIVIFFIVYETTFTLPLMGEVMSKHLRILFFAMILSCSHAFGAEIMWASKVISYSSQFDRLAYSASQVIGPPSRLPTFGDCGCAWSPSMSANTNSEFIRVGFEKKIKVSQIVVSEIFNAGAIKEIYLFDQYNIAHLVYKRDDKAAAWKLGDIFSITIPPTDFLTNDLKLVLDTESIDGFNQIDAIGIAEATAPLPSGSILVTDKVTFKGNAENLGSAVNSYGSEIAPLATPDGNTLYFTRKNHPGNMGMIMNDDIWVSHYSGSKWSTAENLGGPINNESNNYVVGISDNGDMLTLANTYHPSGESRMGIAQTWKNSSNTWNFPVNLITPGLVTRNLYAEYYMNAERSVMLMTLQTSDSYGLKDIYVSFSNDQLFWTEPINLGPDINTSSNEMAPFLSPDGKTLFFSSNGWPGYGDQDIFVSVRLDNTWKHWSKPENLGTMINTSGFEAYFSYPDSMNYAFFASTGPAKLNSDIYRIPLKEIEEPEDTLFAEKEDIVVPEIPEDSLLPFIPSTPDDTSIAFEEEIVVPEKMDLDISLSNELLLFGTIYDATTDVPINADLTFILNNYVGTPINISTLNNTYRLKITDSVEYKVTIIREGYLPLETVVNVRNFREQKVKRIDFKLTPLLKGEKMILDNVYFDANKSIIKPESYEELNALYTFLVTNPGTKIEIGGHTNGLCSETYCEKLSQNRANAVREYLISKGIDPVRITAIGYGSKVPIDTNDTAEGRKRNQRVEITFK